MKTKHLQSVQSVGIPNKPIKRPILGSPGKRFKILGSTGKRPKILGSYKKEDSLLAMFMVLMDMVAQADGPQMFVEGIPNEYPGVKKISKIADLAHEGMKYLITHPDFRISYDKAVQIVGNVDAGYPTYPFTSNEYYDEDDSEDDESDDEEDEKDDSEDDDESDDKDEKDDSEDDESDDEEEEDEKDDEDE